MLRPKGTNWNRRKEWLDPETVAEKEKPWKAEQPISFRTFDCTVGHFVSVREGGGKVAGGVGRGKAPGSGFREVSGLTMSEAMAVPEYRALLAEIVAQVGEIERCAQGAGGGL